MEDKKRKQYARQNQHIKENYHRQTITIRKEIHEAIKEKGESLNGLVNKLLAEWLERGEK